MAIEKALFTTQADFKQQEGIGISIDPFLSYDADNRNDWSVFGTPGRVAGIKGNAETYKTSYVHHNTTINPGIHVMSMWFKPTASDVAAAGNNWRILFTHRGFGQTNRGFHLALWNGQLHARIYNTSGGLIQPYSMDSDQIRKTVKADTIYQLIFIWNSSTSGNKLEIWMNDGINGWELWIKSGVSITLHTNTRQELTIGDMPVSASGGTQYAFDGWIDEFMYWTDYTSGVPSIEELKTTYRDYVLNAAWMDTDTEPGSMMLGRNAAGLYTNKPQFWTSPVIDIGEDGFGDFGRLQINFEQPAGTGINVSTRSSSNRSTWNNWIKVAPSGQINSPDQRYLQIQVELFTIDRSVTPKVMEIQVLDYPKVKRLALSSEPLIIYKDLASGLERMGELVNAYDVFIVEEVNGEETLEFKMAANDPKRHELGAEPVELIAEIGDKRFIIRNPIDRRDESGKKYTQFTAEATWYELRDHKVIEFESVEDTALNTLNKILDASIEPTGWTIYKADPTIKRTIRGEWKSVLELLHEVRDQFGGELLFDTVNRTISLVNQIGENNGIRFYYNKNLKTIERSVDSYGIVTRLYLYGKNGMTIASVNNNVEYLENTKWVDALGLRNRIRIDRLSDGRYTIPQNLKEDGQKMLDEMSKPIVSYAMTVNDLSVLSGHEHEQIGLGDTVYAVDTELMNMHVEARIVRRKYNVREPWKTEIELNQPKKELADANKRSIDDAVELLAETDPLDTSDVQQMTVFNHLLNSRAEDGMAYWEQTGTGVSVEMTGFSGSASWKLQSGYGSEASLKQSVFGVSHRTAYTVSAYVYNDGTITRGPSNDAFVGIRVRIHYETADNEGKTYEDHYLAIPDITQETPEEGEELE